MSYDRFGSYWRYIVVYVYFCDLFSHSPESLVPSSSFLLAQPYPLEGSLNHAIHAPPLTPRARLPRNAQLKKKFAHPQSKARVRLQSRRLSECPLQHRKNLEYDGAREPSHPSRG